MKERDYGSYIEDIVEHMNYAEEFVKDMAGIRDRRLVHGYFKVNLEIVWMTVTQEFPELRPMMEKVLNDIDF